MALGFAMCMYLPRHGDSMPKIATVDVAQTHVSFLFCDNNSFVVFRAVSSQSM